MRTYTPEQEEQFQTEEGMLPCSLYEIDFHYQDKFFEWLDAQKRDQDRELDWLEFQTDMENDDQSREIRERQ